MNEIVEEKLKDIIFKVSSKQIDRNEITGSTSFIYDLGMDSISLVQMLVDIEEKFGIDVIDGTSIIDNMINFESLVQYIIVKKGKC